MRVSGDSAHSTPGNHRQIETQVCASRRVRHLRWLPSGQSSLHKRPAQGMRSRTPVKLEPPFDTRHLVAWMLCAAGAGSASAGLLHADCRKPHAPLQQQAPGNPTPHKAANSSRWAYHNPASAGNEAARCLECSMQPTAAASPAHRWRSGSAHRCAPGAPWRCSRIPCQ